MGMHFQFETPAARNVALQNQPGREREADSPRRVRGAWGYLGVGDADPKEGQKEKQRRDEQQARIFRVHALRAAVVVGSASNSFEPPQRLNRKNREELVAGNINSHRSF